MLYGQNSMRITLIHNPWAGRGKHAKKDLIAALAKSGHHAIYHSTKESDYKKNLKKPTDLILAAGGDGTIGKVARRLIGSGIPLSVLPLGTANNLARSLGFIASPEEIIARLGNGEKRAFDVALARGPWGKRYFFEGAGGGLLADYLRAVKGEGRKIKKVSKELEMAQHVSLLHRMLHDYPARRWKIEIDDEDISDRYILWEAMNIRSVGTKQPKMASSISFARARPIVRFSCIISVRGWRKKSTNFRYPFEGSAIYGSFGEDRRFTSTTSRGQVKDRSRKFRARSKLR